MGRPLLRAVRHREVRNEPLLLALIAFRRMAKSSIAM
jgi:hypothetical protein